MSEKLNKVQDEKVSTSQALDDEQRVKVLSPGMLVAKRFFRNKLAMVGLVIIVAMFLFAFVGGVISPYGESQVFRKTEVSWKDFAGAAYNDTWIFNTKEGEDFPAAAQQKFVLASSREEESFEAGGMTYEIADLSESLKAVIAQQPVATVLTLKGKSSYKESGSTPLTDEIKKGYEAAVEAEETTFEADGESYTISKSGRQMVIAKGGEIAFATKKVFNGAAADTAMDYEFQKAALTALDAGEKSFVYGDNSYEISTLDGARVFQIMLNGEVYGTISDMLISPLGTDAFLSLEFKEAAEAAILAKESGFEIVNEAGETETYQLQNKNTQYVIRNEKTTMVNDKFRAPDKEHLLGTDGNGMDMLTRLMYGGRVSLMIGFVVIILEIVIGIVIGGISGYFGGWVDTILMRVVDIVVCIPAMPLYIIIGAVMDSYKIDSGLRIYALCIILGLLSWPGIARMVRGQILSLREQEFMIATEATGIRVSRRIFRHLVPNVIPQLIVMATMGLGDVILMEATLSFLGLGVKFPLASWGNIVNAVNDSYVLTNFWFVWIPAGFLILITVLGFNFVGDGLRDAFDPKMKR